MSSRLWWVVPPRRFHPLAGMPTGKPAGTRGRQLSAENRPLLFGRPERPAECQDLQARADMGGQSNEYEPAYLTRLEKLTTPSRGFQKGET